MKFNFMKFENNTRSTTVRCGVQCAGTALSFKRFPEHFKIRIILTTRNKAHTHWNCCVTINLAPPLLAVLTINNQGNRSCSGEYQEDQLAKQACKLTELFDANPLFGPALPSFSQIGIPDPMYLAKFG